MFIHNFGLPYVKEAFGKCRLFSHGCFHKKIIGIHTNFLLEVERAPLGFKKWTGMMGPTSFNLKIDPGF